MKEAERDGFHVDQACIERQVAREPTVGSEQIHPNLPTVAGLKTSPTRLEHHAAATLEFDHRHRIILHVEGFLGVDVALAPIHLANTAGAETRMRLGQNRSNLKFV